MTPRVPRREENAQRVYSSDVGRVRESPTARDDAAGPPRGGVVRVSRTKAGRKGKVVTLVMGLPPGDLADVARALKRLCGSGGAVKDGVVEIQGDHRDRVATHLEGVYTVKHAGG
jgi:translation initiation factor 1